MRKCVLSNEDLSDVGNRGYFSCVMQFLQVVFPLHLVFKSSLSPSKAAHFDPQKASSKRVLEITVP